MATYTGTPKTWTAGEELLASDFNAEIRDPVAALSGAWTAYTPTLGGFTLGSGTTSGYYIRVGSFVVFRANFTFGSGSAAATTSPTLTLPVTAADSYYAGPLTGWYYDTSTSPNYWPGFAYLASATAVAIRLMPADSTNVSSGLPSTTTPFTWATGDRVSVAGMYQAA